MDTIEKVKGFFSKLQPWQWLGIGVVSILGVYAYYKKANTSTQYEEPALATLNPGGLFAGQEESGDSSGSSSLDAGAGSGTISDPNAGITSAIQSQSDAFTQAFNNVVGTFQNSIVTQNKVIDQVNQNVSTLRESLNTGQIQPKATTAESAGVQTIIPSGGGTPAAAERSASVISIQSSAGYGNNGAGYNAGASAVVQQTISSSPSAYIAEVARVEAVYSNRAAAGMDTTAQTNYAKTIQASAPVNLGNNGIGYDAAKSASFESSLKTNTSAYNAEISRVNEVIANRTAAGLDTTAQTNYLNKIK
jgi:hypothetical protein